MVYRSNEDVNVEERAMAWCQLSRVIRVERRRIERRNARLDAMMQMNPKLGDELMARCAARNAQTAAGWAHLEVFRKIEHPTHQDILAYLAQSKRETGQ